MVIFIFKTVYAYLHLITRFQKSVLFLICVVPFLLIVCNVKLSKILLLLSFIALPMMFYLILNSLLASNTSLKEWRDTHHEIHVAQFHVYFYIILGCIIFALARDLFLVICAFHKLEEQLVDIDTRFRIIRQAMTRAAESLESGRLADVGNYIESVKNIAQTCAACAFLGWCNLWDEFTIWMHSCFYTEAHTAGSEKNSTVAGSSQSSTGTSQKESCAKLLDNMKRCASDPRCNTTKLAILSETVKEIWKEPPAPPKGPWVQGPLWENRYESDGGQSKK